MANTVTTAMLARSKKPLMQFREFAELKAEVAAMRREREESRAEHDKLRAQLRAVSKAFGTLSDVVVDEIGSVKREVKSMRVELDALQAGDEMRWAKDLRADLEATGHDIPIPTNDRVLRYVELFQGRLKDFLEEGLSRATQYLPMIQDTFRAEGLPLDLAYIPLIESAFKPTALSRAKARGVWQFMHGTALENGLKADWYLDERADPKKSTLAAAKYLKTLFEDYMAGHQMEVDYSSFDWIIIKE